MDLTGIWWKCLPLHSPVLAYCTSSSSQLDKTFVGGKHRISHTDKQKISQKDFSKRFLKRANIGFLTWTKEIGRGGELVVLVVGEVGGGVVGGRVVVVVVGEGEGEGGVGGGVVGGGGVVVVVGGEGGGGGGEQIDDSLYKSRDLPQAPLLSS